MRTIAEGVEHAHQHSRLRVLGCDYGQGYLFSKPLGEKEMDVLLTRGVLEVTGEQAIVVSKAQA